MGKALAQFLDSLTHPCFPSGFFSLRTIDPAWLDMKK